MNAAALDELAADLGDNIEPALAAGRAVVLGEAGDRRAGHLAVVLGRGPRVPGRALAAVALAASHAAEHKLEHGEVARATAAKAEHANARHPATRRARPTALAGDLTHVEPLTDRAV